MPTITPVLTLDLRGVADLHEKLTGKRTAGATIRSLPFSWTNQLKSKRAAG